MPAAGNNKRGTDACADERPTGWPVLTAKRAFGMLGSCAGAEDALPCRPWDEGNLLPQVLDTSVDASGKPASQGVRPGPPWRARPAALQLRVTAHFFLGGQHA
jgi:hypothetical protein